MLNFGAFLVLGCWRLVLSTLPCIIALEPFTLYAQ
jgi:hypothetical protein